MDPFKATLLALTMMACGSPPPQPIAIAPERLADVAMDAFAEELRALGYRVGAGAPVGDMDAVVASRDARDWYLSLGVEPARAAEGPKWILRLSVFREPRRELRGEITPSAIAAGAELDASGRRALVRALGKRAADQFAENFANVN